jgi:hypothetical protein
MNVNNFFRFIGEKFPEYKLSADNEPLMNNFFATYQRDVTDQNIDGDNVVSLYFAVDNEGTMDENGKNGKFVQYSADAEMYRDDDNERDIDFKHYKNIIDFKNDVKDGNDELYEITDGKNPKKLMDTEYKNGNKVKRVRYKYFYEFNKQKGAIYGRKLRGPYIDNVTHYDSNGNEYAVDFYRYVYNDGSTIRPTTLASLNNDISGSELSYRKILAKNQPILYPDGKPIELSQTIYPEPIIYFDKEGNKISKEEWNELIKKR